MSLVTVEVFYPSVVASPVRQTVLTRQKTGWNEIKSQFLWKPEKIGLLIHVKRISEEKVRFVSLPHSFFLSISVSLILFLTLCSVVYYYK